MQNTVLVVDDLRSARRALAAELSDAGFRVVEAADGREGWRCFQQEAPDLVLSDLVMPKADGLELLARIRDASRVPVVLFTSQGGVPEAVAALKGGADEFVVSRDAGLAELVGLARRFASPRQIPDSRQLGEWLVGGSPAIQRTRERIVALAPLREPVLVVGEPGSGRDTAARALHELGSPGQPFWVVNRIGGRRPLTETLAAPPGGSVYLDDLEVLEPAEQRLLAGQVGAQTERNAQTERTGETATRWLAAATPRWLARAEEGGVDARLAAAFGRFQVPLPALRDRPEDVPRLARQLAVRSGRALGRARHHFSDAGLARLRQEQWPGNVAELARVVEKAVAFAAAPAISAADVEEALGEVRLSVEVLRERHPFDERGQLVDALRIASGNVTRAAGRLGRSRQAVYRLAEKHGVPLRRGG
jgi:DNA-binding NtrC family response regulator